MKAFFIVIFLFSFTTGIFAQAKIKYDTVPEKYAPYIYAKPGDIQWFTDAKFGVFVHWGPYTLAKVPASWGRFGPRPGAGKQATEGVPREEYDNLYKKFNPVDFDADKWIKMVKDAGAKYFIFTTKHHDGFCMFDAKNTDYKITNTPFGRDVAKEIADACHKYGIKLFWYYSQPDWHHPDCLTENNDRYRKYMYQHLEQLFTDYGKIDGLFFDERVAGPQREGDTSPFKSECGPVYQSERVIFFCRTVAEVTLRVVADCGIYRNLMVRIQIFHKVERSLHG